MGFQISPQPVHRQYDVSEGDLLVAETTPDDPQNGQVMRRGSE
ncbi:MAG TPA: hypothetical protein VG871_03545 [Vicinamibacterales bacterium]|nr:hypothetical protein [Vicinamibacterales bacterium]